MFLQVPAASVPASHSMRTGQWPRLLKAPKVKKEGLGREGLGRRELVKAASKLGVTGQGQNSASQAGIRDGCLLVVFRRH